MRLPMSAKSSREKLEKNCQNGTVPRQVEAMTMTALCTDDFCSAALTSWRLTNWTIFTPLLSYDFADDIDVLKLGLLNV